MRHNDIIDSLQNLIKVKPRQKDIADILGVSIGVIGNRAVRNSNYPLEDVIKLSNFYNVKLLQEDNNVTQVINFQGDNLTSDNNRISNSDCSTTCINCKNNRICEKMKDRIEIFYLENLPDSWKHPSLTTFNFDREMLEDIWQRKRENVKVVAMAGDKMDGGQYPFKNRDILLIDTSATDLSKSGAFFFSSRNNKNYFLCNLDLKINGDVEFSYNNPKYTGRIISEEELKELDFRIIGRVFKNESFYL